MVVNQLRLEDITLLLNLDHHLFEFFEGNVPLVELICFSYHLIKDVTPYFWTVLEHLCQVVLSYPSVAIPVKHVEGAPQLIFCQDILGGNIGNDELSEVNLSVVVDVYCLQD